MWLVCKKFNYSTESLARVRKLTSSKVCYKPNLNFLKFRTTLCYSLSNRLVYRSQYLTSYKNIRSYYLNLMRANFTTELAPQYASYVTGGVDNTKFIAAFVKTKLMREFDYALLWKGVQTNALFNVAMTTTKKKKKKTTRQRVFFISPGKRLLFVWRWLSVFIKCLHHRGVPRRLALIRGFENFLLGPEKNQIIHNFKLQIYKVKLLRAE